MDPHSVYISPEQIKDINQGMSGFYKGMGIETIYLDDTLRVVKVLGGSPADQAGISYGDMLLTVNDSLLAGQNRDRHEQWEMLRTKDSGTFKLVVLDRSSKEKEMEVFPKKIKAPNVDYFEFDGTSYINILRFSDKTYEGIVDALESLQKEKTIDRLIIDLRNNPGGYLPEATKILNQLFVEDKRLLVYTEDRTKRKTEYNTTGRPFYEINKLAVLVNEGSASASEIIAGALQDWDKAILIGNETFGKGLVQEQFDLSNGGAIRLTTARYYTPSGRSIQRPYNDDQIDSTAGYYSKTHERALTSFGGIAPDYLVSWSELEQSTIERVSTDLSINTYKILRPLINSKELVDLSSDDFQEGISRVLLDLFAGEAFDEELARGILTSSIYSQLEQKVNSDDAFAEYDIYIKTAVEKLKMENVFADFMGNK